MNRTPLKLSTRIAAGINPPVDNTLSPLLPPIGSLIIISESMVEWEIVRYEDGPLFDKRAFVKSPDGISTGFPVMVHRIRGVVRHGPKKVDIPEEPKPVIPYASTQAMRKELSDFGLDTSATI